MQPILVGMIVAHAAFPAVFLNHPERQQDGVDGYIALSDCSEIGNRYVLVRQNQPDALVAVADCAAAQHVTYRNEQGLIADVDTAIWAGEWREQPAELWRIADREAYWQRWTKADSTG